jgi:hypothetical protein
MNRLMGVKERLSQINNTAKRQLRLVLRHSLVPNSRAVILREFGIFDAIVQHANHPEISSLTLTPQLHDYCRFRSHLIPDPLGPVVVVTTSGSPIAS